jgi:hypothetical protein
VARLSSFTALRRLGLPSFSEELCQDLRAMPGLSYLRALPEPQADDAGLEPVANPPFSLQLHSPSRLRHLEVNAVTASALDWASLSGLTRLDVPGFINPFIPPPDLTQLPNLLHLCLRNSCLRSCRQR